MNVTFYSKDHVYRYHQKNKLGSIEKRVVMIMKELKVTTEGTIQFALQKREHMEQVRADFKYLEGCHGKNPK